MSTRQSSDTPPTKPKREYERSGMYPKEGKQFRMFALLGWLAVVVVLIVAVAALLDFMLIY